MANAQLYSNVNINTAIDHAIKTVGLANLKREQREAIQQFLSGKDDITYYYGCN